LPSLIAQGLLQYKQVYKALSDGYYGLQSTILTLAFMALCRIKNVEQLKQHNVGELGILIGLDRVPEGRCLREKMQQIVVQNKAKEYNTELFNHWLPKNEELFFYIDGHVRIYYGYAANLPVKYISRQKLCLNATTEYWVNDIQGLPYLVFMGALTEKMQDVIEQQIIPELKASDSIKERIANKEKLLCTIVIDRECYEPAFFQRLLEKHQTAVITYRKNVKDKWDENVFKSYVIDVIGNKVTVLLCEQVVLLGGIEFREVRSLNEGGHQTAIITTNPTITIEQIASKMFSRWSQENFFKYLIADYDFDKMIEYGTEKVSETSKIVNPAYRKISSSIKKATEKIRRQEAKFYTIVEQIHEAPLEKIPTLTPQQLKAKTALESLKEAKAKLVTERLIIPTKIMLKDMPEEKRLNKLKTESKLFLNVIKMICYRAETNIFEIITPHFQKSHNEGRMLIKQLFSTPADIIPDAIENTLTIGVNSLSTPRYNEVINELCVILNQSETIFPGTNLRLIYKCRASQTTKGKEF